MNTPFSRPLRFFALLLLAALAAPFVQADEAPAAPFAPGTRWMLLGDSITQDGRYPEFLRLFLATRFPGRNIALLNAGIAGDNLEGALRRYSWDVAPKNATFATVMFGMNDVGRTFYQPGEPDEETLQKRETSLRLYRERLESLTKRLRADGVQVVLVSPSMFDDGADLPSANLPGCNAALARCTGIVRETASTEGSRFVDVHGPMTAFTVDRQSHDPSFSLVGGDRIHPSATGHLFIMKALLRELGAPAVVSSVTIDADKLAVVSSDNAEVGTPVRDDQGTLRFLVHARSLPFPVTSDTAPGFALLDFADSLNRESLQITGLRPGAYMLSIDGTPVRSFTADELAAGIRLDGENATPQHRRAVAVAEAVRRWGERLRSGERIIAQVEHQQFGQSPRPLSASDTTDTVRAKLAEYPDKEVYQARILAAYLREKPREAGMAEELAALDKEITAAATTAPQEYALTPQ